MLAARGQTWADIFHQFAIGNYFFASSYAEGALYATVPGVGPQAQQVAANPSASASIPMAHASNDYYLLTGSGGSTSLRVTVTLPGPETGPRASAIVMRAAGNDPPVALISGNSTLLPFDSTVTGVLLVLTNGSTRFDGCGTDQTPPFFTCYGTPLDETVSFGVTALVEPSGP